MKFSEKMVTLLNPCPKITEAELCTMDDKYPKLAPEVNSDQRQAFNIEFKWSAGSEADILVLGPGEERPAPQELARSIIREVGEQGLVMITEAAPGKNKEAMRLQQIIQGLRVAITFYAENGILRLSKMRRRHGWSEQEMHQMEHQHRAYYLNQRKHDLIEEVAQNATKKLAEISARARKSG
jgi:hypothetical protein